MIMLQKYSNQILPLILNGFLSQNSQSRWFPNIEQDSKQYSTESGMSRWIWHPPCNISIFPYNKNLSSYRFLFLILPPHIVSRSHLYITGNIGYTPRKITLTSGDVSYFVRPYSIQSGYVHGDRVRARITKR